MRIIALSTHLRQRGMTDDDIKAWLPDGIASRKDLAEDQAEEFIANLNQRLRLIYVCADLATKGVDSDTMKNRLPNGVQSLKDLSLPQVEEAIKAFTHWLKTYNEVVEGSVING